MVGGLQMSNMNSNNQLNIRTRFGKFISWGMSLDIDVEPPTWEMFNGVFTKALHFPSSLVLNLQFEKRHTRYKVEYEARNVSDEDTLLIQSDLMKYLRKEASKTKFGGYPKNFMVGEAKFQLRSVQTG